MFHKCLDKNSHNLPKHYLLREGVDVDQVKRSRAEVAKICGLERVAYLNQIHSDKVVIVDENYFLKSEPQADAMVTVLTNIGLAIQTADCLPILLSDEKNGVIGALHAGWRGAYQNIMINTIDQMINLGASLKSIQIYVGPAIRQESYEVDESFYRTFIEQKNENHRYFIPSSRTNHYLFDLPLYAIDSMISYGIEKSNIVDSEEDTLKNENQYFSYRRCTLGEKKLDGSSLSVIWKV